MPKSTPICQGLRGPIPEYLKIPSPFTFTVAIGEQMRAGQYSLAYTPQLSKPETIRNVTVASAAITAMDDFLYTTMTDAVVAPFIPAGRETRVILRGVLPNTCVGLPKKIEIFVRGDVIVVLPILETKADALCESKQSGFKVPMNLGILKPGRYLSHVRSANGISLNRVFSVTQN